RVVDGQVSITPLPALHSRDLVREAMLLTGQAVAQYAQEHSLALPYSVQDAPDELIDLTDGELSRMFAQRRRLRPGQSKAAPGPHSGLGLDRYVQATSPLRRYADLLVHQQVRAHLRGEDTLDAPSLMERIAEASAGLIAARRAERLSNNHWKLVYLLQNPEWKGEGIVVDSSGTRATVVIPELDLETNLYGRPDLELDEAVRLQLSDV
ncbi:MAG: RNB domain-containing ribonuclease, partial [Anaerolineales bacterium]|nr:RNB domain-containing ribonuclease [Anaerolineales bacterium]